MKIGTTFALLKKGDGNNEMNENEENEQSVSVGDQKKKYQEMDYQAGKHDKAQRHHPFKANDRTIGRMFFKEFLATAHGGNRNLIRVI